MSYLKILKMVGVVLLLSGTGCGRDRAISNRDYEELKLEPVNGKTADEQFNLTQVFRITLVHEQSESKLPEFTSGETGTIKVRLDILDKTITQAVLSPLSSGEPRGLTITPSPTDQNIWLFKWTPPLNFLEPGEDVRQVTLSAQARVTGSEDPRLRNVTKVFEQPILVRHPTKAPLIVQENLPVTVQEGRTISFVISTKDPVVAANGPVRPNLELFYFARASNDENPKYNGTGFLKPDVPAFVGPDASGVYIYRFLFLAQGEGLPVPLDAQHKPDLNADGVNVCFSARAVSNLTGLRSNDSDLCTRVLFEVQPPLISWDDDEPKVKGTSSFIAGQENKIGFWARIPSGRGNLSVTALNKDFATWPSLKDGGPKVVCEEGRSEGTHCQLIWTPNCNAKQPHQLNLQVVNEVTQKSITTRKVALAQRRLNFQSQSDDCKSKSNRGLK